MYRILNKKDIDIEKVREFYAKYSTWKVTNSYEDWKKIVDNSASIITIWYGNELVASARGLSDWVRWATIVDVLVHPQYRGRGLGKKLINTLIQEEAMDVRTIYLATPNKEEFYNKLGFKAVNDYCKYMVKVNKDRDREFFLPKQC